MTNMTKMTELLDPAKYGSYTGEKKLDFNSSALGVIRIGFMTIDCNKNFSTRQFRTTLDRWGVELPEIEDNSIFQEMSCVKTVEYFNLISRYNNWNNQTELAKMSPKGVAEKKQLEMELVALVDLLGQLFPDVKEKVYQYIQERIDAGVFDETDPQYFQY
jgi:hypothetical protein